MKLNLGCTEPEHPRDTSPEAAITTGLDGILFSILRAMTRRGRAHRTEGDIQSLQLVAAPRRSHPTDRKRPLARPLRRSRLLSESEVLANRYLRCTSYDQCLNTAIARTWTSWTCSRCPKFELERVSVQAS